MPTDSLDPGASPRDAPQWALRVSIPSSGHQNSLENQPSFLCYLVVGSIYYPMVGAGLGALYLLSRISYASGYATGNPKNRQWGSYGYIGLIGLLGLSVHSLLKIGGLL